jgi:hypothetical protein
MYELKKTFRLGRRTSGPTDCHQEIVCKTTIDHGIAAAYGHGKSRDCGATCGGHGIISTQVRLMGSLCMR